MTINERLKDIVQFLSYTFLLFVGAKIMRSATAEEKAIKIKIKRLSRKKNTLKKSLALKKKKRSDNTKKLKEIEQEIENLGAEAKIDRFDDLMSKL